MYLLPVGLILKIVNLDVIPQRLNNASSTVFSYTENGTYCTEEL